MRSRPKLTILLLVLMAAMGLLSACGDSGPTDPRETVFAFFGAMEKNDQAALAHLLDLVELMKNTQTDYSLNSNEPRVFTNPVDILQDLTGTGLTKTRWFSMQRIVNRTEINGESATVEVSFVDKTSSTQYLTKFGLHIVDGKWKIYSFKVS